MTDTVSNSVRAAPDDLVDAHRTACDRLDRAVTDPHVPGRRRHLDWEDRVLLPRRRT